MESLTNAALTVALIMCFLVACSLFLPYSRNGRTKAQQIVKLIGLALFVVTCVSVGLLCITVCFP
ncbi:MAG: hypothetical protein IAA31_05650 [Candidatus Anaerobiospirillum merdipullorum]|uniref:Uncharacterized protein n=1 Tax=Candidatus Anaerobiospirillum merdipullorum TaxID=2838450 RepID=A0A9E2NS87_9GAMM|nr:hypothetical protein [Candidatus Anaerobiospirillum merdipullorum]